MSNNSNKDSDSDDEDQRYDLDDLKKGKDVPDEKTAQGSNQKQKMGMINAF